MGQSGEENIAIHGSFSINAPSGLVQATEEGQGIIWVDKKPQ